MHVYVMPNPNVTAGDANYITVLNDVLSFRYLSYGDFMAQRDVFHCSQFCNWPIVIPNANDISLKD